MRPARSRPALRVRGHSPSKDFPRAIGFTGADRRSRGHGLVRRGLLVQTTLGIWRDAVPDVVRWRWRARRLGWSLAAQGNLRRCKLQVSRSSRRHDVVHASLVFDRPDSSTRALASKLTRRFGASLSTVKVQRIDVRRVFAEVLAMIGASCAAHLPHYLGFLRPQRASKSDVLVQDRSLGIAYDSVHACHDDGAYR